MACCVFVGEAVSFWNRTLETIVGIRGASQGVSARLEACLATLPAEHPHRNARPDAFAFGDSPSLANELATLVQTGRKRATASLPIEFTSEGQPLPASATSAS